MNILVSLLFGGVVSGLWMWSDLPSYNAWGWLVTMMFVVILAWVVPNN